MAHWSGAQSGWNTRGGTWKEHLQIQLEQAERRNPNSGYWRAAAEAELGRVADELGEDYDLWAEITWPGETIRKKTWKEIYETAHYSLNPVELWSVIECTCNGVTDPCGVNNPCKVCQALSRLNTRPDDSMELVPA